MVFLDRFRPKWKNSKGWVRKEAINSGKLSSSTLIRIISNKNESTLIRCAAIAKVNDDKKLAKLVFGKGYAVQKDIVKKISTISILQTLEKEACSQNREMFSSYIKSRIEDIEIEAYADKSNEALFEIVKSDISWKRTQEALRHISDSKLLVQWLTCKYDENQDRSSLSGDEKEAVTRLLLKEVVSQITSLRLLAILLESFYKDDEKKLIVQQVVHLKKVEEFIQHYNIRDGACCHWLLKHITNQKKIIQLIDYIERPALKLKAYALAADEVRANKKYLGEMIQIIENSKDRLDGDVETFLKEMGQKVIYRMTEKERSIKCDICNGTGRMPYCDHGEKCDSCGGSGRDGYESYEVIESIVVN